MHILAQHYDRKSVKGNQTKKMNKVNNQVKIAFVCVFDRSIHSVAIVILISINGIFFFPSGSLSLLNYLSLLGEFCERDYLCYQEHSAGFFVNPTLQCVFKGSCKTAVPGSCLN